MRTASLENSVDILLLKLISHLTGSTGLLYWKQTDVCATFFLLLASNCVPWLTALSSTGLALVCVVTRGLHLETWLVLFPLLSKLQKRSDSRTSCFSMPPWASPCWCLSSSAYPKPKGARWRRSLKSWPRSKPRPELNLWPLLFFFSFLNVQ